MGVAQKDILNGWKEIASYVARDIRTVERWEKQRGLPVRRVPGAGRATVYARISELEEWLASEPTEAEISSGPVVVSAPIGRLPVVAAHDVPVAEPFSETAVPPSATAVFESPHFRLLTYGLIAAFVVLVCATSLLLRAPAASEAVASTTSPHKLSMPHSNVPGVDESYLRGSFLYEQRTPESLAQALDSFNSAIQHDPNYAPAYAGLANTYNLLREYSVMPDSVAYPKAGEAAEHAIALDPTLAQAYVSLGFVSYYWYLNAAKAESEFQKAIELDPTLAQAHHWYGSVLTHEGRFAEAVRELNIAQNLEPSSSAILTSRALALGMSGHMEQARAMLRDLLSQNGFSKDPNSVTTHLVLGIVSAAEPKDWGTQLEQWREVTALCKKNTDLLSYVKAVEPAYRRGGEPAMWQAALAYEKERHPTAEDATMRMAEAAANLGQFDVAFHNLNQLADRRDRSLIGLSLDPMLAPLHSDPRFAQVRARLGLTKPIA